MKTTFTAALLVASAFGFSHVLPVHPVGKIRHDDADSKLVTRATELS
jgi:hypothetical protein